MTKQKENEEIKCGLPSIGIPAEILFNPKLAPTEKILFGFIRNLSKTKRGCWASNRFLGELVNCGKQTASNAIANLKKYGYIKIQTNKKDKLTEEIERRIYEDPSYPERYRELVELFHEVYINLNRGVKETLYRYIKEFITEEDREGDSQKDNTSSKDLSLEEVGEGSDEPSESYANKDNLPLTRKKRRRLEGKPGKQQPNLLGYGRASSAAKAVVEHWRDTKGSRKHPRNDTKLMERVVWLLDNRILKRNKPKDIKQTITDYHYLLRNGSSYLSKQQVGILEFFELSSYQIYVRKKEGHSLETWFKRLSDPDACEKYLSMVVTNDNPEITKLLKKSFCDLVLNQDGNFGMKQEGDFIVAAKKLKKLMGLKRLEKCIAGADTDTYIMILFKALAATWGYDKLETGNLASDHTYNTVVPRYITGQFKEKGEKLTYETLDLDKERRRGRR